MSTGRRGFEVAQPSHLGWTPERAAECKRLYIELGHSARQTALILGGTTRDAVVGLSHRRGWVRAPELHGLNLRAVTNAPRRTDPAATRSIRPLPRKDAKPPVPAPQEQQAATVALMGLKACHCRWPIGTPGEPGFGFCGHPIQEGSSYCPTHERKAHQPSRGRLSDAAVGIRRRDKSPVPTFADYERRLA